MQDKDKKDSPLTTKIVEVRNKTYQLNTVLLADFTDLLDHIIAKYVMFV